MVTVGFRTALLATCLVLGSCALAQNAKDPELKKLSIIRCTQAKLDDGFRFLGLPKLDDPNIAKLRTYLDENAPLKSLDDPKMIISTLAWVNKQWSHDGQASAGDLTSYDILQKAKEGTQWSCVEYGRVMADVLLSYGYASRILAIQTPDVAYGGGGSGHVVSEIWSNALGKWIFVDPQFGLYAKSGDKLLNFYELYEFHKKGKLKDVEFVFADPGSRTADQQKKEIAHYRDEFLSAYFGQALAPFVRDGMRYELTLLLDAKKPTVTFQGFPAGYKVFATDPAEMYPNLNQTMVVVGFQNKAYASSEIWGKLQGEEFLKKMHTFAATPNLSLSFQHNMPWFDHFEVKVNDGPWTKVENPRDFVLDIADGKTTITAVAVNKAGLRGVPTTLELGYGL